MEPPEGGQGFPVESFSTREIQILRLIARGLSNDEIARALFLSNETIRWYNQRIFTKLSVNNRTKAVLRAKELGLLAAEVEKEIHAPAVPLPRHNLPSQVSSFVGRLNDIARVNHGLKQCRLLTLTGIGGTGKTRLALQVARQCLPDFRDGVYFVPLADVRSPEHVLWALTEHLDFSFDSQDEPLKQLLDYLRPKALLLILDNFEHLLEGASLVTEILQAAPNVKIIVTSRERLGRYGEVVYPVGGMVLPHENQPQDTASSESVVLFMERAHSVAPTLSWNPHDLHHIARICCLVDGIPLGIELAATWIDTLQPQEIADEIEHDLDILRTEHDHVADGRQSIRAAFDRSWRLLNNTQQTAFRNLAVFRGGFTRKAAEAIAGLNRDILRSLTSKSLVRFNQRTGRYEIHELLRFYAEEQLVLCGESVQIYHRHAAYFADFMDTRWHWMKDQRQKQALQDIEADLENTRAAWHYWIAAGDVSQLQKFFHSFWVTYDIHGWYRPGIELFEQAAQVMRADNTTEAQASLGWLLSAQGLFSIPVLDYPKHWRLRSTSEALAEYGLYDIVRSGAERGLALALEGVQILKRVGSCDERLIIPLMSVFIAACHLTEEETLSLPAAEECLEVASKINDSWSIAKAKHLLAVRAIENRDYVKGESLAIDALTTFDANRDNWSSSVVCIEVLAFLAVTLQQYESANAWLNRGLKAAEEIDFRYSMQTAYWQLGYVAALQEDYVKAGVYWQKAMAISDRMLGGHSFIGFGRKHRGSSWGGRTLLDG